MSSWPTFEELEVVEHLSTESVAEVYAAEQPSLGRRVVVKALRSNVLPSSPFAAALQREAQILGGLCHPNVQRIFGFHRDEERMWLVLEHTTGWSLQVLLEHAEHLSPAAVTSIGLMVAGALQHCHSRGVVHRNLQPSCLMVASEGRVTLTGFVGAVKDRLPTAPELLDGTLHSAVSPYLSPEHVLGETTDGRSDLFSLGVILYEMATGRQPFAGPDERTVAQRIRHDVPPPPSRSAPGLPAALERTILRCLEKLPEDRFDSAGEVEHALAQVLEQEGGFEPERWVRAEIDRAIVHPPSDSIKATEAAPPTGAKGIEATVHGLIGLVICGALVVGGGLAVERGVHRDTATQRRGAGHLELSPEHAGFVRIVVDPWAKVRVDGHYLDTTPMARPVPLPPGVHYVHFEHPRAPIERREVKVSEGETLLLDVVMKVAPPSGTSSPPPARPDPADAGDSP